MAGQNGRSNGVPRERGPREAKTTKLMRAQYTVAEWLRITPEPMREAMAARALEDAQGSVIKAAVALGFPPPLAGQLDAYSKVVIDPVFHTPGVKAILERDLREPEEWKRELLSRQVRIALYGDNESAIRAFANLARICGWNKGPDVVVQHNSATILALVHKTDGQEKIAAHVAVPGFLEHDPGAPVRIDSDSELVDRALEAEE